MEPGTTDERAPGDPGPSPAEGPTTSDPASTETPEADAPSDATPSGDATAPTPGSDDTTPADAPSETPAMADPFAEPPASDDSEDNDANGDDATDEDDADGDESSPSALPPKHSLAYTSLLVARLNPLGLEERFLLEYRYRLYDSSSLLKDGSYISAGIQPIVSPAMARVSASVFVQPLAVLRFHFAYGLLAHFGTFQFMQSYDTPTAEHFTAEYRATDQNRYASLGGQGQIGILLQAKVKSIAVRNNLNFYRTDIDLKDSTGYFGNDKVFYYIRDDIMLAAHGWHLTNDTDVLYLGKKGLTAGIRTSVVKAFYPDDVFLDGESTDDPNGPTVRMGPLVAYTFYDKPEKKKRFNKPTLLVMSQWWLKHRYRTGAAAAFGESISDNPEGEKEPVGNLGDSLPAMPWFVLGFAFQGELFGRN